MLCRATQDRRVMVESSDKTWSTGEGNGKPLQHSCPKNHMNSVKRQKDMILKHELPRLVGAQYDTGEEGRNCSREEEAESKWKECPVVDVSGGESKVRRCKEQHCIGIWNVRSMNQGKWIKVKQEMARVNVNILGISEPKWMEMGEFNSDDHYIYDCGQESLWKNGVTSSKTESKMQYLGSISKTTEWFFSVSSFPRKTIQYHRNLNLCPNY